MASKWQNLPVLVTGAGGFIGSRLVRRLVEQGARVRAFVRYNSRADFGLLKQLPAQTLAQLEIIAGDLRDAHALALAAKGVELVFHLGALISIPYSYLHPDEVVESNILGTLNVLQACRTHGCRLVHTSTSEVYGSALTVPISEEHPLQGQSPYSASKIGADKLVESFYRAYGVQAVTVRPFNTYGPGQSARAVIPTIITQALTQDVIQLGNLEAKRDFTYLDDTVDGFIKAGEAQGVQAETFNLGSGTEISIGELADLVIRLVGKPVKIALDTGRLRPQASEVTRLLSDNSKARHQLGWQPQTSLLDGLSHTIAWIAEHLDFYRVGTYER